MTMSGSCSPKSQALQASPSKSTAGDSASSSTSSSLVLSINVARTRSPLSELPIANFFPPPPSPVKSSHVSPSKRRSTLYFGATHNSMSPKRASLYSDAILTATRVSSPSSSTSSTPSSRSSVRSGDERNTSTLAKKRSNQALDNSQSSSTQVSAQLRAMRVDREAGEHSKVRRKSTTALTPSRAATQAALAERRKKQQTEGAVSGSPDRKSSTVDLTALNASEERRKGKLRMRTADEIETDMLDGFDLPRNPSPSKRNGDSEVWTVWQDNDMECNTIRSDTIDSPTNTEFRVEDDKENSKPDPVVLQGRRKGTGGRLSLVAQEDASSMMETSDQDII